MAMHSSSSIAAAVSNAGALGLFGGTNFAGPDWLREEIRATRELTDRSFGVGFITHLIPAMPDLLNVALEEKVPVIAFSFADPAPYAAMAKDAGATVICQVQTTAQARLAMDAGADLLVAQGNEAGGHTGTMTLLPLIVELRAAYPDVPLMAAGGITNGPALAAALTAGAEGAWLGTAFLATDECTDISDAYKQAIVAGSGEDTIYSSVMDIIQGHKFDLPPWPEGIALRSQRNALIEKWHGREAELRANIDAVLGGLDESDVAVNESVLMGQGAAAITSVRPASEVIRSICGDAERALRDLRGGLLRD